MSDHVHIRPRRVDDESVRASMIASAPTPPDNLSFVAEPLIVPPVLEGGRERGVGEGEGCTPVYRPISIQLTLTRGSVQQGVPVIQAPFPLSYQPSLSGPFYISFYMSRVGPKSEQITANRMSWFQSVCRSGG